MKYVIERRGHLLGKEVVLYLTDKKNSKEIPRFTDDLRGAEILTENETYEWLGRLWSDHTNIDTVNKVKINPKTLKLDYIELY